MVTLMYDFMNAQQKREERYLLKIQGLRESILQSIRHATTPTPITTESPGMELLTPAHHRWKANAVNGFSWDTHLPMVPAPESQLTPRDDLRMPVFQQGEDIENYLWRVGRLARTWRWPEEVWSYRLIPLLTGQMLEAYLAMDEEQAKVYDDLKSHP